MKWIQVLLLLTLGCIGCQKKTETIKEQILRINFQEGDLPSLHPHDLVIYLRGLSISKSLFEPLTRVTPEGKVEPAAAERIEQSDDHLHYTFFLRKNHWSDGTIVTASDYEKAWKAALDPSSSCSRADLLYPILNAEEAKRGEITLDHVGVKAIDETTLQVDLSYPSPYFLELVAQAIAFPIKNIQDREVTFFNGPFVVDTWKKGDFLRLKPNPHYWDRDSIHLDRIEITFIEDINTAYALFEKGNLDWMGVPLCALSLELIQQEEAKNQLKSQPIARSFWIFLNTQSQTLSSPSIRRALSLALDRKAITNHLLIGGHPSKKPLSSQLLPLSTQHAIEENIIAANEEFERGLEELGFTRSTFPALEISYSQQSMRKQLAEYLQQTWQQVLGIQVQLKSIEWNILRTNLEKGLFCISMAYEGAYYKDPLELMERYTSDRPGNFSQWIYPPFAEKIQEAKHEKNNTMRVQRLNEAEEILLTQMPFIPICSDCVLFSHTDKMTGYVIDSLGALDVSRVDLNRL